MAFSVAKLLNSDASDRAQIDSLTEAPEYFLEEVTDESVADDDEDDNFANYITDEDEYWIRLSWEWLRHGTATQVALTDP